MAVSVRPSISNDDRSCSRTKVTVENVNHPGSFRQVDAVLYEAMKQAYLALLSAAPDGLTLDEIRETLGTHLCEAGWWSKNRAALRASSCARRRGRCACARRDVKAGRRSC
jgi:hypothetical protein